MDLATAAPRHEGFLEALLWWRAHDPLPLQEALAPPVDQLGDEILDVYLAVLFRRLVERQLYSGQLLVLLDFDRAHRGTRVMLDREPGSQEAVARYDRMLAVAESWRDHLEAFCQVGVGS